MELAKSLDGFNHPVAVPSLHPGFHRFHVFRMNQGLFLRSLHLPTHIQLSVWRLALERGLVRILIYIKFINLLTNIKEMLESSLKFQYNS